MSASARPARPLCAARCGDPASRFLEPGEKLGRFTEGDGLCTTCYLELAEGYVAPDPSLLRLPSDGRTEGQRTKKV